ncbi:MAG: MBL fold metallo-hydrolase [Lachnospiraceae bacterium]|nr:MBL fold metallo-hydrolase [Lachnospiraceae bacterium]
MKKGKRKSGVIAWIILFLGICGIRVFPTDILQGNVQDSVEKMALENVTMEVHFIDVGQGDATLIKSGEHAMLIDAGDNDHGTAVQLYLQKQGVEKLDYLILTHTDADHIGGADVIVTKFPVDTMFMGDFPRENRTYEELLDTLEYKDLDYAIPEIGSEYALGNANFTIIAPNKSYDTPNNSGIALVLRDGENSFLFTGDCEEEAEKDILANGLDIDCDVYKVGHHGSSTSSSKEFLETVTPSVGVISCAVGNDYGHPHREPMEHLERMGVKIFRTDKQGSIVAYSDRTELVWVYEHEK